MRRDLPSHPPRQRHFVINSPIPHQHLVGSTHEPRSESGFSLVEVIVVLLILAIVVGGITALLGGSRKGANEAVTRQSALLIAEAVDQFQRDHGGRPPGQPGASTDWNTTWTSPVDAQNNNLPYIKPSNAESFSSGTVSLETADGRTAPGRQAGAGRVRYFVDPVNRSYAVVAYRIDGADRIASCWVSASGKRAAEALAGRLPKAC